MTDWIDNNRFRLYQSHIHGPDGSVYMYRYIFQSPWWTLRAHRIMRHDLGDDPHDHPWAFLSLLLGPYDEKLPTVSDAEGTARQARVGQWLGALLRTWSWVRPSRPLSSVGALTLVGAGGIPVVLRRPRFGLVFHFAEDLHRIVALPEGPVWTLVVTGPYERRWGFQTPSGWVYWRNHEQADTEAPC